jgi:hypothetical protein
VLKSSDRGKIRTHDLLFPWRRRWPDFWVFNERPDYKCVCTFFLLWNSWIQLSLQNEFALNESLSMNVLRMCGIAFYTWQIGTRHKQRKWRQDLHRGEQSRRNFLTGDTLTLSTMLGILISMLTYIYSIFFQIEKISFHIWNPAVDPFHHRHGDQIGQMFAKFRNCLLGQFLKLLKLAKVLGYFFQR